MSYVPETLVLTLSRQCNIECSHCIVEAEPRISEELDVNIINSSLRQAKQIGIRTVCIYGGEPFLQTSGLLPHTIRQTFAEGFPFVSIGTNGFWGRTEAQAQKTLSELKKIVSSYDGMIGLGMSVDRFHQPSVPPQSIANIISVHRRGNFPNIRLGIHTFKDQPSFDIVGQVYDRAMRNDLHMIESNDAGYIYPALREEFIEFSSENFPVIRRNLDLPEDADEKHIFESLVFNLDVSHAMRDVMLPKIIARQMDIGNGFENYLIFPNHTYLLDFIVEEKVLNAGRARISGNLETARDMDSDTDYLVIAPNGQAYAYPAHITAESGIIIGNKSLKQVVREVENKWFY